MFNYKMKSILSIGVFLCLFVADSMAQSLQEGIRALENEQFSKAKNIFYGMLKNNTATAETYFYLGNSYYETGHADSAKIFYNKGISLFPQHPLNYIGLGKVLLDGGNQMETKINFDKALALAAPKDNQVHVWIAEAYVNSKNKDIPKAFDMLNRAISINARNPEIYIILGDAFLSDNNGGMAITNYEKALELNPKMARAHARIGVVYTRSRATEISEKAFQDAIAADPEYTPSYRDKADLYYNMRQYDKAKEAYELFLQRTDSTVPVLTRYAYILFLNRDYAKQIDVIHQLMSMDSTNIVLSRLQAYSLYEQKKYAEGLTFMEGFFRKAETGKIIPMDYEYYGKLLGKAPRDSMNKVNRDSLAILNLQKALELDSSKTELYADMGDVYMRARNYPMAQQNYQKKIESSKTGSAIDYFSLGKSYYFNKEYDKGDTAFARVVALKPTASAGYLWRARSNALNEQASRDTAFALYSKYLEIALPDPKTPKNELGEAFRYQGYFYIQKEDNEKARENYLKSLEYDPENKEAKDILNQLSQQKK